MADVNTGGAGTLRLDVSYNSQNNGGNYVSLNWALYLIERVTSNSTWQGSAIGASVSIDGIGAIWSGSFTFDWRGAGNQTTLIASGVANLGNNSDGSGRGWTFRGHMNATGTSGAGGPTDVAQGYNTPSTNVPPNTPTGVAASFVSDTQVNLVWAQSNPTNGQPASNQVWRKTNNGASTKILDISATNSAAIGSVANSKYEFQVQAWNGAGFSGASAWSAPVYTTPAAPTGGTATKNASNDIIVTFTDNVAYAEHTHEVWHGTVSGGVTTWDGAALATLPNGTTSYTHTAPNSSQVHVYRIRAVGGGLQSAYFTTNSVQLLAPPNKPTVPTIPVYADKASALTVTWVHNPTDTTPQTAYEFATSTDGGTTWATSGKVVSTAATRTIAANTYAANAAVTIRIRTWGSASTGGSDGTGASAWSDLQTVTFKTVPTTSITIPANGSTLNDSTIRVTVSFAQAEAAAFVKAQVQLYQGAALLETLDSTIQNGITLATKGLNGITYTVKARVQDSNGLWSTWASNNFSVVYLAPVPAGVVTTFLPDSGFGQIDLSIPAPGGGQAAAATVTITRAIDGGAPEAIVTDYPSAATLSFFDTTATVHGTNTYTITTKSALGAQTTVTATLVTAETRRAYLSKGSGFGNVIVFGGNLKVDEDLSVASDTMEAAGRVKPVGLYGVETSVQLKVSSFVFEGFGSTLDQVRTFLLVSGKACYRDSSGRRVFGATRGSVSYEKMGRGDLKFTLTETS